MASIREFYLLRHEDLHGNSGTGVVARGVVLPSGRCVLEWISFIHTLTFFDNLQAVYDLHSHEGRTEIILGRPPKAAPKKKVKRVKD